MSSVTIGDRVSAVFANATLVPTPMRLSVANTANATISRVIITTVCHAPVPTTAPANVVNASVNRAGQDLIVLAPTPPTLASHHVEVKSARAKASASAVNVSALKRMEAAILENTARSALPARANVRNMFRAFSVKYSNRDRLPQKNVRIVRSSQ